MLNSQPTTYKVSLNKIVIIGTLILIFGFVGGFFLHVSAMQTKASACNQLEQDANNFRDHLIDKIRAGGKIQVRDMNTLLELIDERNQCIQSEINYWKFTA